MFYTKKKKQAIQQQLNNLTELYNELLRKYFLLEKKCDDLQSVAVQKDLKNHPGPKTDTPSIGTTEVLYYLQVVKQPATAKEIVDYYIGEFGVQNDKKLYKLLKRRIYPILTYLVKKKKIVSIPKSNKNEETQYKIV